MSKPIEKMNEQQLQEIYDFNMNIIARKYDEIDASRNTIQEVFNERTRRLSLEEEAVK